MFCEEYEILVKKSFHKRYCINYIKVVYNFNNYIQIYLLTTDKEYLGLLMTDARQDPFTYPTDGQTMQPAISVSPFTLRCIMQRIITPCTHLWYIIP